MKAPRYSGKDLDLSRAIIDSKALIQDHITGLYYPQEDMVKIDGRWYYRENVDEDLQERLGIK